MELVKLIYHTAHKAAEDKGIPIPTVVSALVHAASVSNAVALSGDMHHHCAAELKESYDDPASATLGVEFTNTSISSNGDGSEVAEAWEGMKADNPHIKYHSARRGYVSFEVTPTRWNARFMVLDKVTEPGHPARVGGNFVVEAGKAALQTA